MQRSLNNAATSAFTYLVRSFSDHHVRNILEDGPPSYADARAEYIFETQRKTREKGTS